MMNNEFKTNINNLLKEKKSLISIYVDIFNLVKNKYGNNTIVLIEVGSFYEIYCPYSKGILYEQIKQLSNILNIQLTRKNSKIPEINEKNPYLLGFNSVSKSKFIKKILDTNLYNVMIISQKGNSKEKNVERFVETVLSPGTNIEKTEIEENLIISLNIAISDEQYIIGYSSIDLSTGKNEVGEFYSDKNDKNQALDSIIDKLLIYNISFIIINIEDKDINEEFIINYLELKNKFIIKREKRKLEYQNILLKKQFNITNFIISPIEELNLVKFPFATASYIFLLEHIIDFEENLLTNISKPTIIYDTNKLYIGNNGLEQLNVINNDNSTTLLSLLNCCQTSFGKRLFKHRLLNPIIDKIELNRRYNLIEEYKDYKKINSYLQEISDLEKIKRKIDINKLHPYELFNLYFSLKTIEKHQILLPSDNEENLLNLKDFLKKIENNFIIGECNRFNIDTINENLIQKNVFFKLDNDIKKRDRIIEIIETIKEDINNKYQQEMININYNERDGYYFTITKTRFKLLSKDLNTLFIKVNNKNIFFNEFKIDKRTSNIKLTHPIVKELSNEYFILQNKIIITNKEYFKNNITKLFQQYIPFLDLLVKFISDIDIAVANNKNKTLYNYTKPMIIDNNKQKIAIKDLRHPIIEQTLENTTYISNDLFLGQIDSYKVIKEWHIENNYINGILLFGLNSSGKSSIQKALGLSIIMAQAGMYVPATKFEYTLYHSLFTRIISKDNPDRGLSTFAVEMLELKNILTRGNNKSLVLGDEICHGTETTSGVSIVAGAIKLLDENNINFLFATHLHQLVKLKDINDLNSVIKLHLEVKRNNNVLIYDRKLKYGSGSSIYGLEFAKSLNMNDKFIFYSNKILEELEKKEKSEIKEIKDNYIKPKKYNQNIFESRCAICNEPITEEHHIKEQQQADNNNRIKGIHKNHRSNIVPLCKKHHKMVHEGKLFINGFQLTSEGLKLDYTFVE